MTPAETPADAVPDGPNGPARHPGAVAAVSVETASVETVSVETASIETVTVELAGGPVETTTLDGDPALAPLVFLHEGLGSLRLWRDWPAALAAASGRRALVWSRHGYGASAVVATPRDVGYMHREALEVLPELLDRLGLDAPVLVGHSDGASIALIHAGGAGRPVGGVVALAPHVLVEDRTIAGIEAARRAWETGRLAAAMGRHHTDAAATFHGWNDVWLSAPFRSWTIESFLAGVTAPVLCVQCADDGYGTLEQLRRIRAGVAGAYDEVVLPVGGHAPHVAEPALVTAAVARWLAALP